METLGERTLRIVTVFVALRLEYYWQNNSVDSIRIENLKRSQLENINQIESVMGTMIQ